MDNLEKARKKLAQDKARLENNERLLKLKEGKLRISRLIRVGELLEKANLDKVDHNTLMGALLSIAEQLQNQNVSAQWQTAGEKFLVPIKKDIADVGTPLEISFDTPPPPEIIKALRSNGFRKNSIRGAWEGRGNKKAMEEIIVPHKGTLKEI